MPSAHRPPPLSSEIAQRVVDLVAPTINHNINVMDEHGTIIAGLEPARVGTLHRGAQRVVAERRSVLITVPESGTSDRPGANEPLMIDGRLRGVVGVTGDPQEVAPLARVVALTVQLLIVQEREQDEAGRRCARARDLVAALSSGTADIEDVRARLAAAESPPPWSITLWAAELPGPDHGTSPPPQAETIVTGANMGHGLCAAVLHDALWTVSSGTAQRSETVGSPRKGRRVRSPHTDDPATLTAYAEELRALCRYAGLLPAVGDPEPWSWEIAVAVAHLPYRTLTRLADRVAALTKAQRQSVIAVASTHSMQAAADSVFVHRNTLLQRVDRIATITGLDLRRPDQLASLHMALYAHRALGTLHTPATSSTGKTGQSTVDVHRFSS